MTLVVVAFVWSLLTLIGWLLLAPLQRPRRDALLPVAPLFGAAFLVVALHDVTLVLSIRSGVWLVIPPLVALAVVGYRRDRDWWRPSRSALLALGLTAVCGALPAVFVLGPSLDTGDSGVIQPSMNNDAFYYVSVASWLEHHPATDTPSIGATPEDEGVPPSYAPARAQLTQNMRLGQELTHAAVTVLLDTDGQLTWYPLTALWVLLLPAAGVAAARFLRLHIVTGLVLGTATSMSALVFFQLASQNSDSLMGTALLFLALGAVVRAVGRDPLVPPWLAGIALTALIGTYTEFTPLIAPALVLAVLARRPGELVSTVRAAVVVLACALAVAPLVWYRAVKSLLFLGQMQSDYYPTAFAGAPASSIAGRFLGVIPFTGVDVPLPLLFVVGLFVLIGAVAALLLSRRRWFYAALVLVGLLLAVYMTTVRDRPYTQQRVVQLLLPLVLLVVAVGWDRLVAAAGEHRVNVRGRRSRPHPIRLQTTVAGVGLLGAVVFTSTNGVVDHRMDLSEQAELRHVGPEFAEAAGWVRDLGGREGEQAAVLVGDFFSQLWITDALRNETEVAYPSLFVSYQATTSYWSGEPRRWLLTDRSGIRRVDVGVVVAENERFALLDLSQGRAVVAVPADEFGQNSLMVLRSESSPTTIRLLGSTRARAPTDPAQIAEYHDLVPVGLQPGVDHLLLELDPSVARRVVLSGEDDIFVLRGLRFGP